MVNVNAMPCATCVYYNGVKQPDGAERTEYMACQKAKSKKSEELLYVNRERVKCDSWKDDIEPIKRGVAK